MANQVKATGGRSVLKKATFAAAVALTASPANAGDQPATALSNPGQVVQFVRFESKLPREAVLAAAEERKGDFAAMPGLVQKYYLELDAPNTYGGIYIWESKAAMAEYLQSDLFKTIPAAYGISSKPEVEIIPVLYPLR